MNRPEGNRTALDQKVLAWMGEGSWARDDERFGALALETFAYQLEHCLPYRRFCEARGASVDKVRDWRAIPAVPTGAFKEIALRSFAPECEVATFRTSGTSGVANARRGELHLDTLALYEASLLPSLRRHVLPDLGEGDRIRILVLTPAAEETPDSSLSHMFSCAVASFGTPDSGFFVERDELQVDAAWRALSEAGEPVALCGTAFSFVHLLEARPDSISLPAGSRIMETGGFKGRAREIPRDELYAWLEARLAVPRERIVNQYGMTELGSQFYDSVLAEPDAPRRKLGPPWVRVRLIDPTSDRDVEPGQPGVITVHDLANTGSVAAVTTADLGVRIEGVRIEPGEHGSEWGFEVLGREPGAEARGCSIAADLMLGG